MNITLNDKEQSWQQMPGLLFLLWVGGDFAEGHLFNEIKPSNSN
jgi:hypothetical protein